MKTFTSGQVLAARDLNSNFSELMAKAKPTIIKRTVSVNYSAGQSDYWSINLSAGGFRSYPLVIPIVQTGESSHITATPYSVTSTSVNVRVKAHEAYNGRIAIYCLCFDQADVINV